MNLLCIEEGIDSSQTSGKLLISVLSAIVAGGIVAGIVFFDKTPKKRK